MKGETVEEIVGFAEAIRAAAAPLDLHAKHPVLDASGTGGDALVDTCGTGGDASGTFNISTATAFVVAGAGVRVAKHGNRSVTSKCGSADVMEALGVNIDLPVSRIAACLEEVGIAFLFAPSHAFGDETRADRPPRAASAHGFQSAWSANESRARHLPGSWSLFRRAGRQTCRSAQHVRSAGAHWLSTEAMGWMRSRLPGQPALPKCAKDKFIAMKSRPKNSVCEEPRWTKSPVETLLGTPR